MRAFTLACLCLLFTACSWGDGSGNSGDDAPPDAAGPKCGDGTCAPSEIGNCAADCGAQQAPVCGNGTCEPGENNSNCLSDCPTTPVCNNNGTCEAGETNANCAQDCPLSSSCPANVEDCLFCAVANILCPSGLDMTACTACVFNMGGSGCVGGLPNMVCDAGEDATTCPFDCM